MSGRARLEGVGVAAGVPGAVTERPIEIDLNAPVYLSDMPAVAHAVWRWWVQELQALLPLRVREAVPPAAPVTYLHVEDGGWRFVSSQGPSFEIDPQVEDKDLAAQILAASSGFSIGRLVVVLPAQRALRRMVELPLLQERQIVPAVGLQVDRLTPFKAGSVLVGARLVARDAVEGKLTADCVFVPVAFAQAVTQRLAGLGLAVERHDIAGEDGVPLGFNMIEPGSAPLKRGVSRGKLAMVALAIGSWWLAGVMQERARAHEVDALQARIDALRPQVARSIALRTRIDGLAAPAALAQQHRGDAVLSVLDELTRALPDTARLTELDHEGQRLRIAGVATDAAGLIPRLEASTRLRDVKFLSQVMRVAETDADRFEIGAVLEEAGR